MDREEYLNLNRTRSVKTYNQRNTKFSRANVLKSTDCSIWLSVSFSWFDSENGPCFGIVHQCVIVHVSFSWLKLELQGIMQILRKAFRKLASPFQTFDAFTHFLFSTKRSPGKFIQSPFLKVCTIGRIWGEVVHTTDQWFSGNKLAKYRLGPLLFVLVCVALNSPLGIRVCSHWPRLGPRSIHQLKR